MQSSKGGIVFRTIAKWKDTMKFTKFFVFFTLALLLFAGLTAAAKHDDHKSKDDHKSRDDHKSKDHHKSGHHESGWDKFVSGNC